MEIYVYMGLFCGFNEYINFEVKEYYCFMELIREYNIIVWVSDIFGIYDVDGIFDIEIENFVIFLNDFVFVIIYVIINFINIVILGRNIKKIYI